ncbi:MAG: quinone oxidoreductase [Thermoanaerobaculales bacterium]|nr:quinone oxidoreductase [Thermoanaerobaculales bacterium]
MNKTIIIHEHGGPEVLRWEEKDPGRPGPGQALLRHTAIGLNFIDTYHRTGLYPLELPTSLGIEAAAVVEAVGPGVTDIQLGDRVAYAGGPPGAYSQTRIIPAHLLVPLPAEIDDQAAAAVMIKGLTAQYLLRRTYRVEPGDTILVHAAAGGVGLLTCRWASELGATVIGTVGNDRKAELAREHGCHHTIVYTRENFVERVKEITAGEGVPVVYDSVGKDTWDGSLDCLRPLGMMVSYGNASGPVPAFEPALLALKGSLFLTRPTLFSHIATRETLLAAADELFAIMRSGTLKASVNQVFPLEDAADAHRALEARQTTGASVLLP